MPSTAVPTLSAATAAKTAIVSEAFHRLSVADSYPQYPQQSYYIDQPAAPGTGLSYREDYLKTHPEITPETPLPLLFQPFTVKNLTIPNRVVVAPLCMYCTQDGFVNDFHLVHLGSFALHGAGLIIAEATAIEKRGRITPGCAGIWSDDHIPGFKRIVDFVHAQGGVKIGLQLAHSGRKGSDLAPYTTHQDSEFWHDNVVAPTGGLVWGEGFQSPKELTITEIQEIVEKFGDAAKRAEKAGFDTIEIHGAHGYLIHSFLSPLTNHRTDAYGGSIENRTRFLKEVIAKVRANFPVEKPIFLRVSASDLVDHLPEISASQTILHTIEVAKIAYAAGVDVIHVSSGGNTPLQLASYAPGYQVPFAEAIKKAVPGLHVIAVGVITGGKQAEEILIQEKADLVAVGRTFMREPAFVLGAATELGVKMAVAQQYSTGRI